MILTFWGTPRDAHRFSHAHESDLSMTIPLGVLALVALLGGLLLHFGFPLERWVHWGNPHEVISDSLHYTVLGVSLLALLGGMGLGLSMYVKGKPNPEVIVARFPALYRWVTVRYFDRFYVFLVDVLCTRPARVLADFDFRVVDQGVVDGVGRLGQMLGRVHRWVDDVLVDGLVNAVGSLSLVLGRLVRSLQNGYVQTYLFVMVLGTVACVFWAYRVFG